MCKSNLTHLRRKLLKSYKKSVKSVPQSRLQLADPVVVKISQRIWQFVAFPIMREKI
ncbi:hypothetical protein DPMN_012225 [Dreissena polymorpha]|uniref:Uncharacterized protein n=1 Tax=Dreissena polymorpha TaxID=45954 RepID=A0A9D4S2J2_DREPO|nr:hypothetical protein DPMN_012225 [Dreissena polymorpha]